MTLNDMLLELREMSRADKLRTMQFLVMELAKEEDAILTPGASYPVWSPYDSFEAADTLLEMLQQKGDNHAE